MATDPDDQSAPILFGSLNIAALDDRETLLVTAQRLAELTWFTAPTEGGAKANDQELIHRLRRIATGLLDEPQPTPTIFDTQAAVYEAMGLDRRRPRVRDRIAQRLRSAATWVDGGVA